MRTLIAVLFLATIVLQTGVAFASDKDKLPITDDSITDQVRMRLAGDAEVKGGGIGVDVKDGVVTLSGKVPYDKVRQKAERLAKHVKGVKSVVNQLVVDK